MPAAVPAEGASHERHVGKAEAAAWVGLGASRAAEHEGYVRVHELNPTALQVERVLASDGRVLDSFVLRTARAARVSSNRARKKS